MVRHPAPSADYADMVRSLGEARAEPGKSIIAHHSHSYVVGILGILGIL